MSSKRTFVSGASHMKSPQIVEIPTTTEGNDPWCTQTVKENLQGHPISTVFAGRFPTIEVIDGEYVRLDKLMSQLYFEILSTRGYAIVEGAYYEVQWALDPFTTPKRGDKTSTTDVTTGMTVEKKSKGGNVDYRVRNNLVHAVRVEKPEWWPVWNGVAINDSDVGLEAVDPSDFVAKVWKNEIDKAVKADTESTTASPEAM